MKLSLFPIPLALLISFSAVAFSDVILWEGGASGTFSDTGNWQGGVVPGSINTAQFTDAGEVAVNFSAPASVSTISFLGTEVAGDPAKLTFNAGVHTVSLSDSLALDAGASDARDFAFNGDTFSIGITLGINNVSALRESMAVEFSGTAVSVGNQLGIGRRSIGILSLSGGSKLTIGDQTLLGHGSPGDGRIIVSGAGTEFIQNAGGTNNRNIHVGFSNNGQGLLQVLDGGKVTTVRSISIAVAVGSSGSVLVSGANSTIVADVAGEGLFVGGSTASGGQAGGTGTAVFENGGSANLNVLRVFANDPNSNEIGTLTFDASGGVTANTATFDAASVVRFGLFDAAQTVDLTVAGALTVTDSILEAFLAPDFDPVPGNSFSLIGYDSLVGAFANPDGEVVIDGMRFAIDYTLGGQDVVGLTMIPEPAIATLASALAVILFALRRRRSVA